MKKEYTKDEITSFIRGLDVRAKTLDATMIDNIINRGYAELAIVSDRLFSNEDVVDLSPYYLDTEQKISLDIEDDVTEVYDLYLTLEGEKKTSFGSQEIVQDIGIHRDSEIAYRDNRHIGRVHVNLKNTDIVFDNLVAKYYYIPTAQSDSVYMSASVFITWQDAMWAATNYFLKDVEGESQKRASMSRTKLGIQNEPEDILEQARHLFGGI